jgi:2,4-dienoyl-CoA reductase-like NADH-dependent reductase (Old Yellow Enzyme family)
MPDLFESCIVNGMVLANRFVRSATWEGLAIQDGAATPKLVRMMEELALGEVGLIISGHAYVNREGRGSSGQLGAYSDELIPGLADMAAAVHAAGGRIALQISHAGIRSAPVPGGPEPAGPSPVQLETGPAGRAMTREDMAALCLDFAHAAARAKTAGFDAVQIHAAHGFLLSEFLSPFFNQRTDDYGGSRKSRARLVLEVLKAVRNAVGRDFPVLIKMNSEDFLPGGLTVEDMVAIAELLQEAGIDAIELSGGTFLSGKLSFSRTGSRTAKADPPHTEAYYEAAARSYKRAVKTPLMLVGGIRTLETARSLVAEGVADHICLCRPLIREPHLVARWRAGDTGPALCVSDNGCFQPAREGKGIYCTLDASSEGASQP